MTRPVRKPLLLDRLEQGPVTTRDLQAMFPEAPKGSVVTSMYWLRDAGVVESRKVPRENPKGGPATTTEWRLTP